MNEMLMKIGDRATYSRTVSESDVYLFGGVTGDLSGTHTNEAYMKKRSKYGRRVAHGVLILGFMSAASSISIAHLVDRDDLEEFPASLGYDRVRFLKPVFFNDTVTVVYEIASVDKESRRTIAKVEARNQDDELVAVAQHIMKWTPAPTAETVA
jgi:3-hydroxybutyryl-CoA dehydratase